MGGVNFPISNETTSMAKTRMMKIAPTSESQSIRIGTRVDAISTDQQTTVKFRLVAEAVVEEDDE